MRYLMLIVISFLMALSGANAQQNPSLQILIDDISEGGPKCGATKNDLRTPAVLTLRNNRIDVSTAITKPFLYIHSNVLFYEALRQCIWSIRVDIRFITIPAQQRGRFRSTLEGDYSVLCDQSALGSSPQSSAGKHIADYIEQLIKRCLAEVSY